MDLQRILELGLLSRSNPYYGSCSTYEYGNHHAIIAIQFPRGFQQVTACIRPLFRQRVLGERLTEVWRFSSFF